MQRKRVYILKNHQLNETEKLEICRLLIKAGYIVKLGKEKKDGKNIYEHFIEFWEE